MGSDGIRSRVGVCIVRAERLSELERDAELWRRLGVRVTLNGRTAFYSPLELMLTAQRYAIPVDVGGLGVVLEDVGRKLEDPRA